MPRSVLRVRRGTARATASARARAVVAAEPGVLDPGAWILRAVRLPVWPLYAMFGMLPVWWGLGVLYFVWPLMGVVLLALLVIRGGVRLPTGTPLWLVFLGIVTISGTQIERLTSLLTFGLRLGHLCTAVIVGIYVYNVIRDGASWRRVASPLALYFLGMVALGWLGVLVPSLSLPSPFELALPRGIASERYVQDITHLEATEFNRLSANPIYRPAAPYPYTNNWGTAYCFLVPFVLAYLMSVRRGLVRAALLVALPLSLVPAFLTLNRGMFIGLGAGMLYLTGREALKGRIRMLAPIVGLMMIGWFVTLFIPVVDLVTNRTSTTDTNKDRFDLYAQTWAALMRSPLLGFGQPGLVDTTHAAEPLGTQGMVWQLLYSHGIPATFCFFLLLLVLARRMSAAVTPAGLWLSALPVIAAVITPFYAFVDPNMSVLCYPIGLGLAALDGPVNRQVKEPAS